MRISRLGRLGRSTSLALLIGLALWGCGSLHSGEPSSLDSQYRDLEVTCELALMRLQKSIDRRTSQAGFSPVALLEARELHRIGTQLYLEGEYILALEMLEEGIHLLEEESD